MALLGAGYWQTTYWPSNYWVGDYWPEYGVGIRSHFELELYVSPPPREIYFTDIEEEITYGEK